MLCAAAATASVLLILRARGTVLQRIASAVLQGAIWALVWILWQPPALLPPHHSAALDGAFTETDDPARPVQPLAPASIASLDFATVGSGNRERGALRDLPPVRLHIVSEPAGEIGWSVDWPREIQLGDALSLSVSGDSGGATTRVTLEDPFGNTVDNALVAPPGNKARIQLGDTPKLAGHWLYHLRFETGSEDAAQVHREPLPVVVRAPERPAVLLWLARPGFETAALSRWLRQSGVAAAVVTQLAPQIVRREAFNGLDSSTRNPLDSDGPFDLLILDSHLWTQLTAAQRQQLNDLAARKSLLWLVGADSPRGFLDYARDRGMALASTAPVETPALVGDAPPLLSTGYRPVGAAPEDIRTGTDGTPLYWSPGGPGRSLGFVLFDRSYRWITAGFAPDFARLWKSVFERQLRYRGGRTPIAVQSPLPRARQRLTLCGAGFDRNQPAPIAPLDGSAPVRGSAAADSAGGPCASYWPQRAGWYQLEEADGDFAFYVFPRDAWPGWQRRIARDETRQMATARLGPATDLPAPRRPLPLHWIALVLIGLLALTWWRERRSLR